MKTERERARKNEARAAESTGSDLLQKRVNDQLASLQLELLSNVFPLQSNSEVVLRCLTHDTTWIRTVRHLLEGRGCPTCGRIKGAGPRRERTWLRAQRYAESRGGRLLSLKYPEARQHWLWECARGHQWKTTGAATSMNNRTWCPTAPCFSTTPRTMTIAERHYKAAQSRRDSMLLRAKSIAGERGGTCLTEAYRSAREPMQFRCARGHVFSLRFRYLRRSWCNRCSASHSDAENLARVILQQLLSIELLPCRPSGFLSSKCRPMTLDMFNAEAGLAFEFHGNGVHFNHNPKFGTLAKFNRTVELDAEKLVLAEKCGLRLIQIRQWQPYLGTAEIVVYLKGVLFEHRIPFDRNIEVSINQSMLIKDDLAERLKAKLAERNGSLLSGCVPGMLYHIKVRGEKHDFEWQTTPSKILNSNQWCRCCGKEATAAKLRKLTEDYQRGFPATA